ncbi:hypothetical protein [Calidifontibacillus oryziterrae]|uniref:hypothetical protein n=1 Tax=Calidifontibacillus oryziterrae TaxID=1191699 RepID=UPI0003104EED|nr:hypothetical protein [Calidifontibacillus oryziterrae]
MSRFEDRFDELLIKINSIEKQLTTKADEVVMVQVLQHRNELDEIELRLTHIEQRMKLLSKIDESDLEVVDSKSYKVKKQPFLRRVASIFMF